jgi:cytochrome c oxidase assembly factor CtaG
VSGWNVSPLVLVAAAVVSLRFARAFVRLRRRGRSDHAGWDRAVLFAAGLALAVVPLLSPLGDSSLAGHMLEHVLVGDAAIALLVVSVRGPLLFFMVPPTAARSVARRAPLRAAAGLFAQPWLALAAWALAYAAWHVPAAYDYALAHEQAHVVEHVSFIVAGALVWTQLVDPAGRHALSAAQRLAFAGAVFAAGQILTDVLFLAPGPLFPAYPKLGDQQLAALVMMLEQVLSLGLCAALLLRSVLRESAPRPLARRGRAARPA